MLVMHVPKEMSDEFVDCRKTLFKIAKKFNFPVDHAGKDIIETGS